MRLKFKSLLVIFLALCTIFTGCQSNTLYTSTGQNILIESFSPEHSGTYESGNIMIVSVISKSPTLNVTAYFLEKAVQLNREYSDDTDENNVYCFSAALTVPQVEKKTKAGQVKFICKDGDIEEIYYSGQITVMPSASSKIKENVGSGYIAEVINCPAETFDGQTIDDSSKPTNSYLPVGTVDYCSSTAIVNSRIEKSYRLLQCGKRVYENENLKIYEGSLPDNNILSVDRTETLDKYTILSFSCDYKAPFTLELKEQTYKNPNTNNWNISEKTFSYVEIRFMYCNTLLGDVQFEKDNPLFSHSDKFIQDDTYVLRLYLKKAGNFYGFKAEYDEHDCLVFKFLQPTVLYSADNEYGYFLHGKTIVVDAGHGGKDSGAVSSDGTKESSMNLLLANILKNELEKIGATVIMTRKDDSYITANERMMTVYKAEPDFVISVHRNSGSSNGFGSYYFNPFSYTAAQSISDSVKSAGSYRKVSGTHWHYFFLNRTGICPSVLTENGFMSDKDDVKNMKSADHQTVCAKAIVKGIVNYFLSQRNN